MMHRVILLRIARQELMDAVSWYDARSTNAGDRLLVEVNEGISRIARDPERYGFSTLDTRHYRLPTFPYSIHFGQRRQDIVIFAIFHQKRDPSTLRRRL